MTSDHESLLDLCDTLASSNLKKEELKRGVFGLYRASVTNLWNEHHSAWALLSVSFPGMPRLGAAGWL